MPKNNIVTVGWFGDTHVGYRQYGLERRWIDFRRAYISTVKDMISHGVDFIIHTGDLLNSPRPAPEDISALQEVEQMLVNSEKQMLVIAGQHDGIGQNWVEIVRMSTPDCGYRLLESGEWVNVAGLDVVGYNHTSRENLLGWFHATTRTGQILMLHQALQGFMGFPLPSALMVEELPLDRFDVIAIGDLHIHDIRMKKASNGIVGYAGSTELNSETEPEGKAWVKLTFENRVVTEYNAIPIKSRPVVRLSLKTESDIEEGILTVKKTTDKNQALGETRGAIVFVGYKSTIPQVHERFLSAFDPDDFVLRFKPNFVRKEAEKEVQTVGPADLLTIEDMRKAEIPEESPIAAISQAMFNPDVDGAAALNAFVDQRLVPVPVE